MKTQLELAREGTETKQMQAIAKAENLDTGILRLRISNGSVVIMNRKDVSIGIGLGLSTKVNVNLGTSSLKIDPDEEVKKARIAQMYGADTITDLSMGGNIYEIRKMIMENTTLPLTTVPIYQSAAQKGLGNIDSDEIIKNLRQQAKEGMSSFVLHCINKKTLDILKKKERIMGVVSKGGSITSAYMMLNNCENPFISNFEEILSILKKYDIVLSLGNTMRSGCIHDKRDKAQIAEIKQNARLAKIANEAGVQAIIEGMGGHIRADRIAGYVRFHKK
ncbi:MAG TPA: phosphomethylpyrimidine synthase ThiC, partial [Candidatus Methanoperedens sp.]|nr:phosphomethylpyrimidine synthase ThiC [Candidatus Methanoperedens sp.]